MSSTITDVFSLSETARMVSPESGDLTNMSFNELIAQYAELKSLRDDVTCNPDSSPTWQRAVSFMDKKRPACAMYKTGEDGKPFYTGEIFSEMTAEQRIADTREYAGYTLLPQIRSKMSDFWGIARARRENGVKAPALLDEGISVTIRVSGMVFSVELNYTTTNASLKEQFKSLFLSLCQEKKESEIPKDHAYIADGRCWQSDYKYAEFQFWFMKNTVTNDHANGWLNAFIEPLMLPQDNAAPAMQTVDILNLKHNVFLDLMPSYRLTALQQQQLKNCFLSLDKKLREFAVQQRLTFSNTATRMDVKADASVSAGAGCLGTSSFVPTAGQPLPPVPTVGRLFSPPGSSTSASTSQGPGVSLGGYSMGPSSRSRG